MEIFGDRIMITDAGAINIFSLPKLDPVASIAEKGVRKACVLPVSNCVLSFQPESPNPIKLHGPEQQKNAATEITAQNDIIDLAVNQESHELITVSKSSRKNQHNCLQEYMAYDIYRLNQDTTLKWAD